MFSDQHTDTVCAGITSPCADKYEPYRKDSARKHPDLINIREHHRHIEESEKCSHDLTRMIFRITKHHCRHQTDQKRHIKRHKPIQGFSKKFAALLPVYQSIIEQYENIAKHHQRRMFHLEHLVKLPKTDQADHSQHAQQYKISRRQRRKCDDDQKDSAY